MLPPLARVARDHLELVHTGRMVCLSLMELVILHDTLGLALLERELEELPAAAEQLEVIQRRLAAVLAEFGIHAEVNGAKGG